MEGTGAKETTVKSGSMRRTQAREFSNTGTEEEDDIGSLQIDEEDERNSSDKEEVEGSGKDARASLTAKGAVEKLTKLATLHLQPLPSQRSEGEEDQNTTGEAGQVRASSQDQAGVLSPRRTSKRKRASVQSSQADSLSASPLEETVPRASSPLASPAPAPPTRRKARRLDPIVLTVREHQFTITEDAADASLYTLARLWMEDDTHSHYSHPPSRKSKTDSKQEEPEPESLLPPPAPHTQYSRIRHPQENDPSKKRQDLQEFDKLLRPDAEGKPSLEELKASYKDYALVLRQWFQSQHVHRLFRYKERIKKLPLLF